MFIPLPVAWQASPGWGYAAFVGTVLGLTLVGILLAGLSYYFVREHHGIYGVVAVALAFIESMAAGFILGAKRAVAMAVVQGLGSLHLGRSFVHLVFERMPGIAAGEEAGERGADSRTLERLPLAQAEELLNPRSGVYGGCGARGLAAAENSGAAAGGSSDVRPKHDSARKAANTAASTCSR